MSIEYDFYKTNGVLANNKTHHIRVIDHETVDTTTILERIQQGTTLTVHDLKGATSALSEEIIHHLKEGRRVHIEGLGFFSISIEGDVVTDKNEQLRLRNPHVRTIRFQPEERVMKQMKQLSFSCRNHKGGHSQELNEETIQQAIDQLLSHNSFFTAKDFFAATHVTSSTGYRTLNKLLSSHQIINIGTPRHKLYVKVQNQ